MPFINEPIFPFSSPSPSIIDKHTETHIYTLTRNSIATGRRGWWADGACSTFPSDGAEGIKTVSNSESTQQEGVGQ